MKSVCLITRRADLSRAQFRDYYETRHSILGMRYFPFSKYVRNHLTQDEGVDFDCLSEFWQDDTARAYDIMTSEAGDILRNDERQFMTQAKIRPAASEELLIAGTPRAVDRAQVQRRILLLRRAGNVSLDGFYEIAIELAKKAARLKPEAPRVTLDKTTGLAAPLPFPYDALLSLWGEGPTTQLHLDMPEGVALCGTILVDVCESPPEILTANFGKG